MNADQVRILGAPLATSTDLKALVKSDGKDRSEARLGGKQAGDMSCEPDLWVSFFFDGTRNNLNVDKEHLHHSNVARLYRAHLDSDPKEIVYPEYFSGVGTYFRDEVVTGKVDKGSEVFGAGFASGGKLRLECALERIKFRIRNAENQSPTGFIRKIHVAIFGFSRGAALARAFAQMLVKECHYNPYTQQWVWGSARQAPFEIYFMGLFDTVASVGTPTSLRKKAGLIARIPYVGPALALMASNADGHAEWAGNMRIPPAPLVKSCLHLVAAHEVRNSFPLDLVLEGGRLPGNCKEFIYPGVHSDVGGGYWPGEQGCGNLGLPGEGQKLSQIPQFDMYKAAWEAGVPLRHPARKAGKNAWTSVQEMDFKLDPETVKLYNSYLSELGSLTPGCLSTLQAWIEAHMGVYFRWRAKVLDQQALADNTGRKEKDKKKYLDGVETLNDAFKRAIKDARQAVIDKKDTGHPYIHLLAEAWKVYLSDHFATYIQERAPVYQAAVASPPSENQSRFFRTMVHDSASEFAEEPVDGSRLSFPRIFYQGGDDQAQIAEKEAAQSRAATVAV